MYISTAVSLIFAFLAIDSRRALRRLIRDAPDHAPVDVETGLLSRAAFEQRLVGEVKRAQRFDGTVLVSLWLVASGDAVSFGAGVAQQLRFPETGFRLHDRLFCVMASNLSADDELGFAVRLGRCAGATDIVEHGSARYPAEGAELGALFDAAAAELEMTAGERIANLAA